MKKTTEHKSNNDVFTATEVGTLIESFRSDVHVIAERVSDLAEDVSVLKEDMKVVKADITVIKDVLRVELPNIHGRLDRLESKVFA